MPGGAGCRFCGVPEPQGTGRLLLVGGTVSQGSRGQPGLGSYRGLAGQSCRLQPWGDHILGSEGTRPSGGCQVPGRPSRAPQYARAWDPAHQGFGRKQALLRK